MTSPVPVRFVLSKRTFYITLTFPTENSFQLQVWDGKTLWEGEKFGEALKDLVPDGMTHEYYFSILKEAFKIQDADTKRFNYAIARHQIIKTDAIFKWIIKTNVEPGDEDDDPIIPIDLCGEMHLAVVPEDRAKKIIQTLMDSLLFNRNELEAENMSLKTLNEILKTQRIDALELLNRLEQEKRAAEVEQFSKFVMLLNAKKSKITELRTQLQKMAAIAANNGTHSNTHSGSQSTNRAAASHSIKGDGHNNSKQSSIQATSSMDTGTLDVLDPYFDSGDVYSLSTPTMSRKKSDLVLQGALRPSHVSPNKGTIGKPQNIFESQTPSSLASFSSHLKRAPSHTSKPSTSHMPPPSTHNKRSRFEDVLDGAYSDDDDFSLPDPKKWKH